MSCARRSRSSGEAALPRSKRSASALALGVAHARLKSASAAGRHVSSQGTRRPSPRRSWRWTFLVDECRLNAKRKASCASALLLLRARARATCSRRSTVLKRLTSLWSAKKRRAGVARRTLPSWRFQEKLLAHEDQALAQARRRLQIEIALDLVVLVGALARGREEDVGLVDIVGVRRRGVQVAIVSEEDSAPAEGVGLVVEDRCEVAVEAVPGRRLRASRVELPGGGFDPFRARLAARLESTAEERIAVALQTFEPLSGDRVGDELGLGIAGQAGCVEQRHGRGPRVRHVEATARASIGKRVDRNQLSRAHLDVGGREALDDTVVVAVLPGHEIDERGRRENILMRRERQHRAGGGTSGVVEQERVEVHALADRGTGQLGGERRMEMAVKGGSSFPFHRQIRVHPRLDGVAVGARRDRDPGVSGPGCPRRVEVVLVDAATDRLRHRLAGDAAAGHEPLTLRSQVDELVALLGVAGGILDLGRVTLQREHRCLAVRRAPRDLEVLQTGKEQVKRNRLALKLADAIARDAGGSGGVERQPQHRREALLREIGNRRAGIGQRHGQEVGRHVTPQGLRELVVAIGQLGVCRWAGEREAVAVEPG